MYKICIIEYNKIILINCIILLLYNIFQEHNIDTCHYIPLTITFTLLDIILAYTKIFI